MDAQGAVLHVDAPPRCASRGSSQDSESTALFQQAWNTYHLCLTHDLLEHSAMYAAVGAHLNTHVAAPFDMLDLGCGDAEPVSGALAASPAACPLLRSYTGVDMSGPALQLAQQNLAHVVPQGSSIQLHERDMLSFARSAPAASFDVVLASFALHHLPLGAKAEMVGHVSRCLRPGGVFLLVDIFRQAGQSREQYMDEYDARVAGWQISPEARAAILDHVVSFDFPETEAQYREWAAEPADGGGSAPRFGVVRQLAFVRPNMCLAFTKS